VESTVNFVLGEALMVLPLDTINAVANTITAVAVLWAARSLRRSLTDVRFLDLQGPFTSSRPITREQRERLWQDIREQREAEGEDFR
jgi:hypothetical protein